MPFLALQAQISQTAEKIRYFGNNSTCSGVLGRHLPGSVRTPGSCRGALPSKGGGGALGGIGTPTTMRLQALAMQLEPPFTLALVAHILPRSGHGLLTREPPPAARPSTHATGLSRWPFGRLSYRWGGNSGTAHQVHGTPAPARPSGKG